MMKYKCEVYNGYNKNYKKRRLVSKWKLCKKLTKPINVNIYKKALRYAKLSAKEGGHEIVEKIGCIRK